MLRLSVVVFLIQAGYHGFAVSIPLAGTVESLNVSVAAAVLLYEARRQRDG